MKQLYQPIPFSLYTEWELPEYDRYEFQYDNVEGLRHVLFASNPYDFAKGICNILGKDGVAYIYGEMHDKRILYVGHLDKTYVRLQGWNVIKPEPWTFFTPFLWLKDKIVNLLK